MNTRTAMLDHDLEYGRDIRLAGAVALVLVTLGFLFVPQPKVAPLRLRGPIGPDVTLVVEPAPDVYEPPKPAEPTHSSVPLPSDNPEAVTIAPTNDLGESDTGVTATVLPKGIPFPIVERKPQLVRPVQPEYPEMARAAGIEGRVVVSVVVDTLGRVTTAELYATSGNTLLDQAAVDAAYKCGFVPGFQHDRPVIVQNVNVPFNFRLQ
jgi:protein TonB